LALQKFSPQNKNVILSKYPMSYSRDCSGASSSWPFLLRWWADVPVRRQNALSISVSSPQLDAPAVKYRGFFINDEDWGINPWASKTFDPDFKNIGPKTYEKVYELRLRLRLNYLAGHAWRERGVWVRAGKLSAGG